ncbi:MAG: hypothetical protein ABFD54_13500 [Armatimonadota bacterium]|nr:hypothetical protein [bacterium]
MSYKHIWEALIHSGSQSSAILGIVALAGAVLIGALATGTAIADTPLRATFANAQEEPDFSGLPKFHTSDPQYDQFLNEYFMRHLSVDESGIYYDRGPLLGAVDHMWVIEWDLWMLPWIDRSAMGLKRQHKSDEDAILTTLMNLPVDKYGYAWGAAFAGEPRDNIGGWKPQFGWPWPKYNRNYTVTKPCGWDFNDSDDTTHSGWTAKDITLDEKPLEFSLAGRISGPHPELLSPEFDVDVFQAPIIELDITYRTDSTKKNIGNLINGLKVYWTTDKHQAFSEKRMVTIDFTNLPPSKYPELYPVVNNNSEVRYSLYLPMYLHSDWGREGNKVTRLKVIPAGPNSEDVTLLVNYVRATYDVRLVTNNSTLINATHHFYMFNGDQNFLAAQMPKLRRAMVFMNEHLKGKSDHLLSSAWLVGHDGIGGYESGHGVYGSYWDLMPGGVYEVDTSAAYYRALLSMASLEEAAAKRGIKTPVVSVVGPDNKKMITYKETPESLRALAAKVKKQIEKSFWNEETGRFARNIDINGKKYDYGFAHMNLMSLAFGVGTDSQRDSILSWIEGERIVSGDTSTGADIYHYRFGPRVTTKRNSTYYYWAWNHDRHDAPNNFQFAWGNQMQDGGAVPFTSFFDLVARTSTKRQDEIDKAFERTKEIQKWYLDVKSAGGTGSNFYRPYYDNHPERGRQQSPTPGGIGLDREFLSDSSLGTIFMERAFMGIDSHDECVLSVSPAVPSQLKKIGVENVYFRGNHINIEAGKGYVSFAGSKIPNGNGLKAKVTLMAPSGSTVYVDGKPVNSTANPDGTLTVITDLKPVYIKASN